MAENTEGQDALTKAVMGIIKRAATPSRASRMKMARDNLKKAKDARKECAAAIKSAHEMHKTAYLAKASKSDKKPDNDEFDHADAMEKLQKAYSALEKVSTFTKAANVQLKKAAARSGERGQEAGDPEAGFYEVPAGVTDLTPAALAGAAPGSKSGGSQPPMYPGDGSTYAGKIAKYAGKDGKVDANVAALIAENSALEGQRDALARVPANFGRGRPASFDFTKVAGGNSNGTNVDPIAKAIQDAKVNPATLGEDEQARGAVVGHYLLGGHGKTLFDPNFHGAAGGRQ